MTIPKFNALASLYKTDRRYGASPIVKSRSLSYVISAAWPRPAADPDQHLQKHYDIHGMSRDESILHRSNKYLRRPKYYPKDRISSLFME
jgi:hypothetical protein